MRKYMMTLSLLLAFTITYAQDASGIWSGKLKMNDRETEIVFTILRNGDKYASMMDTPTNEIFGILTSSTTLNDSVLVIKIESAGIEFRGRMVNEYTISGNFIQLGKARPLELQNKQAYRESRKRARRS